MHHFKSKNDIIGLDAIAVAGEDGECRIDDKPYRTYRPSGSKRRQSRAAGKLEGDGDFETVRKRGKGFGRLGSSGRGIYQGQVGVNWARDGGCTDGPCPDGRLHVCEHCGSSWHRSFEHPSSGGKDEIKGKELGEEKKNGVSRCPNERT